MHRPSLEDFRRQTQKGNLIPVFREILADMETPVSAFSKIRNSDYAVLLESVEGGEKWARYSFLSSDPSVVVVAYPQRVDIMRNGVVETREGAADPLEIVRSLLGHFRPVEMPELPRFVGGAVGYLGYDVVRHFERLPCETREEPGFPDAVLVVTDRLIVFDNVTHKLKVIANAFVPDNASADDISSIYRDATRRVDEIIAQLRSPRVESSTAGSARCNSVEEGGYGISDTDYSGVRSNFRRDDFEAAVGKVIDYVHAGDVIQVVLAQRFQAGLSADPFDVYRALRTINPSPYMFFLKFGEIAIAGSSPEVLVRLEKGGIEVRPIAGTRKRGRDQEEDDALARDLLADPKERAEHVMLVDLGRNDVGRVAKAGSVEVRELMAIEKYSHVMHIVSSVAGVIRDECDMFDVFRSCFPAGTLSGAPKIRAMEIIEELEPSHRGPYGGAVGFFSFSGNMDMCITIRTIIMRDRMAYIQAGAGLVADSVPAKEYQETVNKARGMVQAVRLAERGLD